MPSARIRFLGQCLLHGYPGVAPDQVFPRIAARRVEASRPGTRVAVSDGDFYHPAQLSGEVGRSLARSDVVVIDVAAWAVATFPRVVDVSRLPRWVVAVNDRIRHLGELRSGLIQAFPLGASLVTLVETNARALAKGALRPLIRSYPRPTVEEYEQLLTEAVRTMADAGVRVVLQGPGGLNPDVIHRRYRPETPRLYVEVNAMTRRVAETLGVPMVDRLAVGRDHRALFLGDSGRYSPLGHRVMGEALGDCLLREGLV